MIAWSTIDNLLLGSMVYEVTHVISLCRSQPEARISEVCAPACTHLLHALPVLWSHVFWGQ